MTAYRIAPNVAVFHHVTKWGAPGQVLEQVKLRAGDEIDVDGDEAERLLKAGAIVSADAPVAAPAGSAAQEEVVVDPPAGGPSRPKHTAPVADWRRYAVACGDFTADEAEELTKAELIEALS